ncbi:MAG: putative glycolipid-binding domain-containing protein [Gemmatimonadota bacterium]
MTIPAQRSSHAEPTPRSILWRRIDRPGLEGACLEFRDGLWNLSGTAVVQEGSQVCRLEYAVVCDAAWRTLWTRVTGWIGYTPVAIRISAYGTGRWRFNGTDCPAVAGATDVDLGFTPSTNLLPIRRLSLAVGAAAPVMAAWLQFPDLSLTILDQTYERTDERTYRYQSGGGKFVADLEVDEVGLVRRYGDIWLAGG